MKRWLLFVWVLLVTLKILKGCDVRIGTKIMAKWILTIPSMLMAMVGMMVNLVRKWRSRLKIHPKNLKENSGARLLDALKGLESDNALPNFQFNLLDFMHSMN
jgi:hypothetical protein